MSYINRLLKIIKKPEVNILPGQIAFFIVQSVVPLIALIGCICSMFSISIGSLVKPFLETVPTAVIEVLKPAFSNPGITVGISIIIGFVFASNGTYSIIVASNLLFDSNSGSYLKRRIKAFFMIFILVLLFFFMVVVLGLGNVILRFILSFEFMSNISEFIYTIFILVKWPVAIILIFFAIKLLYTMSTDDNIPSRYMNKGAIFTTVCCIVLTGIYSYYASNIANYSKFYGNLSNLVILMIWVYMLSYIFVVGIAINSENYHMEKITNNKKD